jgi:YndJ-like protein
MSGAAVWCVMIFVRTSTSAETELITRILLLGMLVIVPLGLSLLATPDRNGHQALPYRLAVLMQPLGAAAGLTAFLFEPGPVAALLAAAWMLVTILIAMFGLWRLLPRGVHPAAEVSIDAGLLYLPIGGVWLVMARLGVQSLGFGDTIVLLTAVHFHFAGFAAPVLAGLAGRTLEVRGSGTRLFPLAAGGIVLGTPLVAAGITLSPRLALIGAAIISAGLFLLAVIVTVSVLRAVPSLVARMLLVISSVSSSLAMCLALAYAYSIVARKLIIDIPQMAASHGIINSFGFALCGLLAWSIVKPVPVGMTPGVPFSKLKGGWFTGPDYFQRVGAVSPSAMMPPGLVNSLADYRRDDFDPSTVSAAVRSFYEETSRYRLLVRPHWRPGFRFAGRLAQFFGEKFGQMRMPLVAETAGDRIQSKLLPLDDKVDGRVNVRAWVRTYEESDKAMYVAAYAGHSHQGTAYMNIAFPFLCGNISSVLFLSPSSQPRGGLALSSLPTALRGGDQGVYFANRWLPLRLPVNELITVWDAADNPHPNPGIVVNARHEMWLCGIKFLELEYDVLSQESVALR